MMMRLFFLLAVVVGTVNAALVQMEPSINVFSSKMWEKVSPANGDEIVQAIFVLKRDSNLVQNFERQLLELSTPKTKNYGKWLSKSELIDKFSPDSTGLSTVLNYLEKFGISGKAARVSDLKDKIHVTMSAKVASEMLHTEFSQFRSVIRNNIVLTRVTKPYFLPSEIASVVSLVDDILRLPSIRRSSLVSPVGVSTSSGADDAFSSCGAKCPQYTTPEVLSEAYSFSTPVANVAAGNSMSVAEFQYQYYDDTDLQSFSSACGIAEVNVDTTIGGNNPAICEKGGCVEALLDIEYIGAVADPIPLTVIYSSTYSLLDWVDGLISMTDPPLVNSVSYGNDEAQQTSTEYMDSCNEQFMAAGSLGLSILFAAGDQGVWGRSGVGATFHPDFPAGSPYVTAVGGTNFATKSVIGEETTWDCGGGGFSDTFARPSWQEDAVTNYLSLAESQGVLPDSTLYNSTGRAYPDVSALGGQTNAYCVAYNGGSFAGVAGTSASCPVVAGIFAQLNNVRLARGDAPLGWLNPLIYQNSQCFQDINDGSQNNCIKGTTGFSALDGWDPATGFGSPNYSCLAGVV